MTPEVHLAFGGGSGSAGLAAPTALCCCDLTGAAARCPPASASATALKACDAAPLGCLLAAVSRVCPIVCILCYILLQHGIKVILECLPTPQCPGYFESYLAFGTRQQARLAMAYCHHQWVRVEPRRARLSPSPGVCTRGAPLTLTPHFCSSSTFAAEGARGCSLGGAEKLHQQLPAALLGHPCLCVGLSAPFPQTPAHSSPQPQAS